MKYLVIIHDDGIFVPQGPSGLHKLVPDAELGATLRTMSNGEKPAKVKRTRKARGPNKPKAEAVPA